MEATLAIRDQTVNHPLEAIALGLWDKAYMT